MAWTFSLRRLLLGMTVLCVVTGLAVNFPQQALIVAAVAGLLAPTLIVLQVGLLLSRRRWSTMFAGRRWSTIVWGLLGALAGICLTPTKLTNPQSWFEQYLSCYLLFAIPPACGAFLLVMGLALDDRLQQPAGSSAPKREP